MTPAAPKLSPTGDTDKSVTLSGVDQSFAHSLLNTLFDAVYTVDRERRITSWSSGAEALTGYSASEAVGKICSDDFLMHTDDRDCLMCVGRCPFVEALQAGRRTEAELLLRHKDGHRMVVSVRVAPLTNAQGEIVGAIQVFRDLSRIRAIERRATELERLAFRDFLTGMPNRRYTDHKVQQALEDCNRFGRAYGLLMIDLDGFKKINDAHGHAAGDALLQAVSRSLVLGLRSNDIIGRWGGEEFLVLAADANLQTLADLAERGRLLIASCAVNWNGVPLRITGSIGATMVRRGETADAAVERADSLMYSCKEKGGNCFSLDDGINAPPDTALPA